MSIISKWKERITRQHEQDQATQDKHGIRGTSNRDWVSPADIEALEEEKVPWLKDKRRKRH